MKLLVLQGPNLNLLGTRQVDIYGSCTLAEIQARLDLLAAELGVTLAHFQSNLEGELVERVQKAKNDGVDGVVVNAAAYTHTSVALRDAFLSTRLSFVEVHLSNVHAREAFRQKSLLSDISGGVIVGLGPRGYELALRGLVDGLRESRGSGGISGTSGV